MLDRTMHSHTIKKATFSPSLCSTVLATNAAALKLKQAPLSALLRWL